MSICKLINVSKKYGVGEEVYPLKDISLEINSGDFISIEGPSGIGKSTLLYTIGGLLKIDSGKIFIDNEDINALSDKKLTDLRGKKLGFIFQDTNLIQALTLEENLYLSQTVSKGKKDKEKIDEILERLGLLDRKRFLPHQLSGGQKRRAMVARGLINDPLLILADEPTNDLDEKYANEVINILKEFTANKGSIVMVNHNTKWIKEATTCYEIDNGCLKIKNI